jgi:hypothetical protein
VQEEVLRCLAETNLQHLSWLPVKHFVWSKIQTQIKKEKEGSIWLMRQRKKQGVPKAPSERQNHDKSGHILPFSQIFSSIQI